jgi:hypothetical protein
VSAFDARLAARRSHSSLTRPIVRAVGNCGTACRLRPAPGPVVAGRSGGRPMCGLVGSGPPWRSRSDRWRRPRVHSLGGAMRSGWAAAMSRMAVASEIPKMHMRWTGSAVSAASVRMRSVRRARAVTPTALSRCLTAQLLIGSWRSPKAVVRGGPQLVFPWHRRPLSPATSAGSARCATRRPPGNPRQGIATRCSPPPCGLETPG